MTRQERLEEIKQQPQSHRHTFDELTACCTIDGAVDVGLLDAHAIADPKTGIKHDVKTGACCCGAWH